MNYAPDGTAIGHISTSCLRKRPYASEAAAWAVIFKIRAEGRDASRLVPYRCATCAKWHLGREPTRLKTELAKIQRHSEP